MRYNSSPRGRRATCRATASGKPHSYDLVDFVNDISTSYGEERQTNEQYPQTWQVKPYDGSGNRSYVTFVFRYRSRGM